MPFEKKRNEAGVENSRNYQQKPIEKFPTFKEGLFLHVVSKKINGKKRASIVAYEFEEK